MADCRPPRLLPLASRFDEFRDATKGDRWNSGGGGFLGYLIGSVFVDGGRDGTLSTSTGATLWRSRTGREWSDANSPGM
jgi:hypothetical protein